MSPSEDLSSYPVVRHFYPIDPATSAQQSSLVYNLPSAPVVAPIQPSSYPQLWEPKTKAPKRRSDDDELEVEALILNPSLRRSKRARKDDQRADVVPIRLLPQPQRYKVYVEVPVLKSSDRPLYKPLSLSSFSSDHLTLGRGKRTSRQSSHLPSWKLRTTSPLSIASDESDDPDWDDSYDTSTTNKGKKKVTRKNKQKQWRKKDQETKTEVVEAVAGGFPDEEEASTCHQCRRKTMIPKMRCRNIRTNDTMCTLFFCQRCLKVRYGEAFDSEDCSWRCPRCRGMCNCSICLRKAGLGYILDNMGEQTSGVRGRLSMGKESQAKRRSEGSQKLSVHAWLARQGILLGTSACTDNSNQQVTDHGGAALSVEASRSTSKHECASPRLDAEETGSEKGSLTSAHLPESSFVRQPCIVPLQDSVMSPKPSETFSATFEEGSSTRSAGTRGVRLSPIPREKKGCMEKGRKGGSLGKTKTEPDDVEYVEFVRNGKTVFKTPLAAIRARKPHAIPVLDDDEKIEYKDEDPEAGSSSGGPANAHAFMDDDAPATPSPPPEPIFVPNEHYTPSKLDLTRVKNPDARFAPPSRSWTLNTLDAESESEPQAPVLFSYSLPNEISDAAMSPPQVGSTIFLTQQSNSTSALRSPNDHLAKDSRYAASGLLSSYGAVEQTWTARGEPASEPGVGLDLPPLMHGLE